MFAFPGRLNDEEFKDIVYLQWEHFGAFSVQPQHLFFPGDFALVRPNAIQHILRGAPIGGAPTGGAPIGAPIGGAPGEGRLFVEVVGVREHMKKNIVFKLI